MATAAVIARILTQYSDKGSKAAQKDIARLEKKISAFGKKALKSFAVAGVAAGAFAVKIGIDAVKGAAEDEKAQTSLAMAIRNSTKATEDAISANNKFLDKLELQVAVDNNELIPALQRLVNATGDLSVAQNLLVLSTDVAVASGKDLGTVSTAISKAINGQFGALTKLGLPIDQTALKQKDLNKILSDFAQISKGQASAAANSFSGRLATLQLSFNQVLDKLGLALMPALEMLVTYIDQKVVPMLDVWIGKNEDELNAALKTSVENIKEVVKAFQDIYKVIEGVNAILPFGIGGWIKLAAVLSGITSLLSVAVVIKKITTNTKLLTTAARGSATTVKLLKNEMSTFRAIMVRVVQKFQDVGTWASKTGGRFGILRTGVNLLIKRWKVLLGLFTVGLPLVGGLWNKMFGKSDTELLKEMQAETKRLFQEEKARKDQAKKDQIVYNNNLKVEIAAANAAALAEAKRAAAAKKAAAIEAKTAAIKKRIESISGLKITDADEYELIQLTAVEKLQKKQKDADDSLAERIKLRKEELALFNSLTAKTAQYLDFLKAINSDGKLDDSELVKLMSKWNLTQVAASKYADFVSAIGDRKLTDTEIENLKNKWGLTTKQVVDYIEKIGAPVNAKGTILSAGDIAALAWTNASSALDAYNAKLKGANITPPPPPTINPPLPSVVQDLIDREMAIDKPFMPGDQRSLDVAKKYQSPLAPFERSLGGYGGPSYASSTFDNGMSLLSDAFSSSGSTQNIYVNIGGSVTSEQDLVQTIRQGLLQGQSSGYGLLLQEI